MKIGIIYGSVRTAREGIKAVRFFEKVLSERECETVVIDPKEYQLPLLDKMYKEYETGQAPETLEKLHQLLESCDGFLIVSAEYNHLPPSALTNLLNYFQAEYNFKPSAIACYSAGTFGGVRAAMALRQFLPELGMPCIPSLFPIGKIQEFADDGTPSSDYYTKHSGRFLDEFFWYLKTFKEGRAQGTP